MLVRGGLATHAVEDLRGAQLRDHVVRGLEIEGGDAVGHVLQHLGQDAAEPERDGRPEARIVDNADQRLEARRHLRHQYTVNFCALLVGQAIGDDLGCSLGEVRCCNAKLDAAGLGLVGDVARDDLHGERPLQALGCSSHIGARRDQYLFRHGDAEGGQHRLALDLGQGCRTLRQLQRSRPGHRGRLARQQATAVLGEAGEGGCSLGTACRRGKERDARVDEELPCLLGPGLAPGPDDLHGLIGLGSRGNDRLRTFYGAGARQRRQQQR